MLEKLNWFSLTSLITLVLSMGKWMGLFLRKNHLLGCWHCVSLLNGIGALTLYLVKLHPKKALICSMKFLFPEVALYLYKATIWPYMEYCSHVWASASSCYLGLLDKLQKQICRTVCPSLAASYEPLAQCQNVVRLSLSGSYYFG